MHRKHLWLRGKSEILTFDLDTHRNVRVGAATTPSVSMPNPFHGGMGLPT